MRNLTWEIVFLDFTGKGFYRTNYTFLSYILERYLTLMIFMYPGVLHSGENDVCGVTLSLNPLLGSWKIFSTLC